MMSGLLQVAGEENLPKSIPKMNGYGVGVGKVPEKESRPKGKKRHRNKKKRRLRHKGGK